MSHTTQRKILPIWNRSKDAVWCSHGRRHLAAECFWVALAVLCWGGVALTDEIFLDDFHDGDVLNDVPVTSEGVPVHWTTGDNRPGIRDASSGDYVLAAVAESADFVRSDVSGLTLGDTSIQAQVRSTAVGGSVGLSVRNQDPVDIRNYFGIVSYMPDFGGTILLLGRRNGETWSPLGGPVPLSFDIRNQDALLQLDAVGNELKLWAWRAGDPMPKNPQLAARDSAYASGFVRVYAGSGDNKDNIASFRFVQVADTHIHAPEVAGDYDHNGVLDARDLDLQARVMIDDTSLPPGYDLDGNRDVDYGDRAYWLHDLRNTWSGDANLDGEFNTGDLVQVLGAGKYETQQYASWSEGDWNGDGIFGTGDLVKALDDGGYEMGPRAAAVPEPTGWLLCLVGLTLLSHKRSSGLVRQRIADTHRARLKV